MRSGRLSPKKTADAKSGTFIIGEAKGPSGIGEATEQLANTVQALYDRLKATGNGDGFKAIAEIVLEKPGKLPPNFGVRGNELVTFVGDKAYAMAIEVTNAAKHRVAQIPIQVRFLTK